MKVYLRQLKDLTWTDITQYVKLPISINDTVDETFDTCKIVAIFNTDFTLFDVKKPFSPKQYIKITTADNPLNETEENTYWFLSDKCKNARIRKESNNYKALYKHEINGIELLYRTTDYNLPNYAITQPKTEYFDVYSRFAMKQVSLNQLFQQDGTSININSGTEIGYNEVNNDDDNIQFGYESNKHYIRLNDTDEVAYNINVLLQYAKTAYILHGIWVYKTRHYCW